MLQARHAALEDPAAAARSWAYLTNAARSAGRALPAGELNLTIERLALAGDAVHLASQRGWPGTGGVDPHLAVVITQLDAAAKAGPVTPGDQDEAAAVLLSTTWMASDIVARRARDYAVDLRVDHQLIPDPATRRLTQTAAGDLHRRTDAAAQLLARTLHTPPGEPPAAASLALSIATWDIEAHRALLTNRSTAALHLVSHHEKRISESFNDVLQRAADASVVDDHTSHRLLPMIQRATEAWADVLPPAAALSWGTHLPPPELSTAATGLLDQLDAIEVADVDAATQKAILGTFATHLSGSVSVAATARDLVRDGEIRGPARAVSRLVTELQHQKGPLAAAVDPMAIQRGVSIVLPTAARGLLEAPLERAVDATAEAHARGASLDVLYRDPRAAGPSPGSRPPEPVTYLQPLVPQAAPGR